MRLYFHLENGDCQIPDHSGLEIDSTTDVRAQALKALEEISTENPSLLVPFREVWVRDQLLATTRRSMRRTMARRTNAAALRA
jgi:hypothetical protein